MKQTGAILAAMRVLLITALLVACAPQPTQIPPTATATPASLVVPPEIPGEALYIPFPVKINVDGNLADWAGVPAIFVDRGPNPSPDPAENGSFTFSLAADADYLYVTMQMPDQNIIAGKHTDQYWNEDSMEFYINASEDLNSNKYLVNIFQVNINATDIGNTDPNALAITGVFSSDAKVNGYVFKTNDGWAFEVSLALQDLLEVTHGKEIGFQAQINGATQLDRDVKLIWSKADTQDQSWEHPNLFGRALFYELGRSDMPIPSAASPNPTAEPTQGPRVIPALVSVNQVGYFTNGQKSALAALDANDPLDWSLTNSAGEVLLSGQTIPRGLDAKTGDALHLVDFSAFTTAGSDYRVFVGELASAPFDIREDLYTQLKTDALKYFYLNRSGIELTADLAGQAWARLAGHLTDADVTCYKGQDADGVNWPGCDYHLNAAGGWYDAGDYGKYVVNGGISAWTLLNLYEQFPGAFPDGSLSIPEKSNGIPDVLDEARWELEFLLSMQVPADQPLAGMVHHKLHDESWARLPILPPTEVENDNDHQTPGSGRYVYAPSTAATLNLAAVAAQAARIWQELDPDFSARCLQAADSAWGAALANPTLYAGNNPGNGGGNYPDQELADEFYWAAAELFITTGDGEYQAHLLESDQFARAAAFDWGHTAPLGTLALLTVPNNLPAERQLQLKQQVLVFADELLQVQAEDGYYVLINEDYPWGSNGLILNNMMLISLAHQISGDARYLDAVRLSMDYILGRNALNQSFVAGYGTYAMLHPHHRFWANDPANGYPPPPAGALSGGPNFNPTDPAATTADLFSRPPAKRYVDDIQSFSTNEVAINWNAPLAWVATYLDQIR